MIYDSLAVSHIRRIAAVLLCLHGSDNSSNWTALDSALAQGARVITGAIATANNTLVILEAGLLDARAMAIAEATRMHCKLLALNMSRSPTVRRAIELLARCPGAAAIPTGVMGAVVDRPSAAPTDAHLASSVHIEPLPSHSPAELEVMKRHALHREPGADPENDPDEVVAAKRAANDRVQRWLRRAEANGAHIFFTDGSVVSNTRNGGGAGACAYFAAGSEQSYSRRAAGRYACSFSAEATGIACVLLMLIAHLRSGFIPLARRASSSRTPRATSTASRKARFDKVTSVSPMRGVTSWRWFETSTSCSCSASSTATPAGTVPTAWTRKRAPRRRVAPS